MESFVLIDEMNLYNTQYTVMQSDRNSFCGNVVLDSFNMIYSEEDAFKTKNMKRESIGIFNNNMKILNFKSD